MRATGTWFLFLALSTTAAGGTTPARQGHWTGIVVDAHTGAPVAGVTLASFDQRWVSPHPQLDHPPDVRGSPGGTATGIRVTTAADGGFVVDDPRAAGLMLTAAGYLNGFVDLTADLDRDLGRLALERATRLRGRIIEETGPAAGRRVALVSPQSYDRSPIHSTSTDEEGRFVLDGVAIDGPRNLAVDGWGIVFDFVELPRGDFELGDIRAPGRHAVEGVVVDADGRPVSGARVLATRDSLAAGQLGAMGRVAWVKATTTTEGAFVLHLPSGRHSVVVQEPGNLPEEHVLVVSEQGVTGVVTLRLSPKVTIRGTVADTSGTHLGGVAVRILDGPMRDWFDDPFPAPGTATDEQGAFALTLPSDRAEVALVVTKPPSSAPEEIRFWGAPIGRHRRIAVSAADEVSITLPRRPTLIAGRVVDEDGRPIAGAEVWPYADFEPVGQRQGPYHPVTQEDGRFVHFGLEPGRWRIRVQGAEGFEAAEIGDIEVIEGRASEVAVVLRSLEPAPDAGLLDVWLRGASDVPEGHATLRLTPRGNAPGPQRRTVYALTDATGRARFTDISPGPYQIETSGGRSTSRPIDIVPGANAATLRRELRRTRPPTTLSGRVVDAAGPLAGVTVTAHGNDGQRSIAREQTTTDSSGSFAFEGVPVGDYVLLARRRGWSSTDFSTSGEVPLSGLSGIELTLEHGATVSGTIAGLTPGETVTVSAYRELQAPGHIRITDEILRVGADDAYQLLNVARGAWTVLARTSSGRRTEVEVEVPPGIDALTAPLTFEEGFALHGRAVFRGEPLANVRISVSAEDPWTSRAARTEDDGSFVVEALRPGRYRMFIQGLPMRSPFVAHVTVENDTVVEVEVRGGVLAGQLVDADTGEGVRGGLLRIRPVGGINLGADTFPDQPRVLPDGLFRVGPLAGVPWLIEGRATGYTRETTTIELDNEDVDDIVLRLTRTAGLTLHLSTVAGTVPEYVSLVWQSADGNEVFLRSGSTGGIASYHWNHIPMGSGILTAIERRGELVARQRINNRGEPVDVVLRPPGFLEVHVEGLASGSSTTIRIVDADGVAIVPRRSNRVGTSTSAALRDGTYFTGLPPGRYTVQVVAEDGRERQRQVEINARLTTAVVFR